MKKVTYAILIAIVLASCSSNEQEYIEKGVSPTVETPSFKTTAEEASEIALDFANKMEAKSNTRVIKKKSVANVEALRASSVQTRSSINAMGIDTLFYIVNFADSSGFAIVSADKRTDPLYAIIDEGNYNIKELEKENNDGFLQFLDGAIFKELDDIRNYHEKERTRTIYIWEMNLWEITDYVRPILKTKWGQGGVNNPDSYGRYCPNKVTGCVITAAAQILAHYRTPGSVGVSYDNNPAGITVLHWDRILADSEARSGELNPYTTPESMNEIAHLCRCLGGLLDANYKFAKDSRFNSTGVNSSKFIKWLPHVGLHATKLRDYNEEDIMQTIKKGQPVFASGYEGYEKIIFVKKYIRGHAWIYDGYLIYSWGIDPRDQEKTALFIHCNWGWDGYQNGFYLSENFLTSKGPQIIDGTDITRSGNEGDFVYNLKYSVIWK